MRYASLTLSLLVSFGLAPSLSYAQSSKPSLEELIMKFQSDAPKIEADVQIDAWFEPGSGPDKADEIVISILPEGETKLNADPGITVTPADQPGIDWQLPLPHRHQDFSITYFKPPAEIRMPFNGRVGQPVELHVEYAYCLVDYQCFFGEETLRVDLTSDVNAS